MTQDMEPDEGDQWWKCLVEPEELPVVGQCNDSRTSESMHVAETVLDSRAHLTAVRRPDLLPPPVNGFGIVSSTWRKELCSPPVVPVGVAPPARYVPVSLPHVEEPQAPDTLTAHINQMTGLINECHDLDLNQAAAATRLNMSVSALKLLCKQCNLGDWRQKRAMSTQVFAAAVAELELEATPLAQLPHAFDDEIPFVAPRVSADVPKAPRRYGNTRRITLESLKVCRDNKMSVQQIATLYSVDKSSVKRVLRDVGIGNWTDFLQAA
jgi:hypothetical protein